jgi:hypothetical protein
MDPFICKLLTERLKKIFFPPLPELVTLPSLKGNAAKYSVASNHGCIRGTFSRIELTQQKQHMAEILNIDR